MIYALRHRIPETRQPLANLPTVEAGRRRVRLEIGHVHIAKMDVRPCKLVYALRLRFLDIRGFEVCVVPTRCRQFEGHLAVDEVLEYLIDEDRKMLLDSPPFRSTAPP